jgi:mycothiol synthase
MTKAAQATGSVAGVGLPDGVPPVPDPPAISGLRFRGLIPSQDFPAMAELRNRCNEADGLPGRAVAEEMAHWMSATDLFDPLHDALLAEVDGMLVATTSGGWEPDNDGGQNFGTRGDVHPDWRRRGLGGALLRWTEARQRQVAAAAPPAPARRLEGWSFDKEVGRNALLEANGYEVVRYWFDMDRPDLEDIPDAPLPEGFAFSPAREEDSREAWGVTVAAFSDHFGGFDTSEESYRQFLKDPNRDLRQWVLVRHDGRIVGESLNRIRHAENEALGIRRGWVIAVGVLPEFQRRGIGRAIVAQSLRQFRGAGLTSARLGVDAENGHGALGLYESLGFSVVERGRIYRKPL